MRFIVVAVVMAGVASCAGTPTASPPADAKSAAEAKLPAIECPKGSKRVAVNSSDTERFKLVSIVVRYALKCRDSDGMTTLWDKKGRKQAQGVGSVGKRHGAWISYDDHFDGGRKIEKLEYKDGVEHGNYTKWHASGQKLREGAYREGKQHGKWTVWHRNGQKKSETYVQNGEPHGKRIAWHDNGQKQLETELKDGKLQGKQTIWHANGQKARQAEYKDGKMVGKATCWDQDGKEITKDGNEIICH